MKLANLAGMNLGAKNQIAFTRAIRKDEEKRYTQTLQQGLRELGIRNLTVGIHAPSFPAQKGGNDWGIGTPYGEKSIISFLQLNAINAVQLGPNGKLDKHDRSPYVSSVVEKNPLLINPEMLTRDEFARILSRGEIDILDQEQIIQLLRHK